MKTNTTLAVMACLGLGQVASHGALVAHYTFDEGSGATTAANQVSGSSTGAIGSLVTTGLAGISGNAYSFGGGAGQDDIVDMGNASFFSSITTAGAYTFSAWINSTEATGGRNVVVFAGNDGDSNDYIDLGTAVEGVDPTGQAYMRHRVNTNEGGASSHFGGSTIVDGTWHHIAMTVDADTLSMNLYVDGVLSNTAALIPNGAQNFPTLNNFEIGRLGRSAPTDSYQGLVDDVQVYDEALTESQIQFLSQNAGQAVPEPTSSALAGLGLLALLRRKRRGSH